MRTTGQGKALERRFRLGHIPTLMSSIGGHQRVTFARIRYDFAEHGPTSPMQPEDSYSVQVPLRSMPSMEVTIERKRRDVRSVDIRSLFLFNLHSPPTVHFHDPIDSFRFYVPFQPLREVADEHGIRGFRTLLAPELGAADPILYELGATLAPALEEIPAASQLYVDHMAAAVLAHLVHAYGRSSPIDMKDVGGLAPWQLRRATDFLLNHLADDPSLDRVATECALSRSHFARKFRVSTGCAPYRWLLERRIRAAKHMLRTSDGSLHAVALACGFRSQSQFNKLFKRRAGVSPGVYRRDR
jgi:AraC family transcriptional regulator